MNTKNILLAALTVYGLGACSDPIPALYQSGVNVAEQVTSGVDLDPNGPSECTSRGSCDDGDPCTEDRCEEGACIAVPINSGACCVSETLYTETFDDLSVDLNQETIHGSLGWGVSQARATSAPASIYFGDEKSGSYATGERVAASMTMPVLVLPEDRDAKLEFQIMADIEPADEYDRFRVIATVVGEQDGGKAIELLNKAKLPTKAFKDFVSWSSDLSSLRGQSVQISFVFDSIDEMNNAYEGVFIDDIRVTLGCPELADCSSDSDCDDGNDCTTNLCSDQGCVSENICDEPGTDEPGTDEPGTDEPGTDEPGTDEPGTDEPGTDEPGTDEPGTDEPGTDEPGTDEPGTDTPTENINPCDLDDAPEDCCLVQSDCDDGNPLTVDTCEGGNCVWTPNPDACVSDNDCADEEACTTESCVDGLCQFTGANDGLCCEENVQALFDFDSGKLQGMFVTDNVGAGVFWRADESFSTSGDYGLTCEDPSEGGYDVGTRVKSSATTPVFEVPVGGITTLRFDLRKLTRINPNVDVFEVFALRQGALIQLFTSKNLPEGGNSEFFQSLDVSLEAYAGQSIQLRFVFDSVNAPGTSLDGVTMDSLELITDCE